MRRSVVPPADLSAAAFRDLRRSESEALSAQHHVTRRAEIYLVSNALTLDHVLKALTISRATWYRRLETLRTWEAAEDAASPDTGGPE